MNELIKVSVLSEKLTGRKGNLRPDKIPKKYKEDVDNLNILLEVWEQQIKNK